MTDIHNRQDDPGSASEHLLRIYRSHALETPPPELDQRILAMAATALAPPPAVRRIGWMRYAASVAVVVLGTGLTWRLVNEGTLPGVSSQREERSEATPVAPAASPATSADARRDREVGGLAATGPTAAPPPPPAVAAAPLPPAETVAAPAPVAPAASAEPKAFARPDAAQDASRSVMRRAVTAQPAPALRNEAAAAPAAAPAAPAATPALASKRAPLSPLDPQVWLQHVRALQESGHLDEARVSLRELRLRYPQLVIPADLEDLLRPGAVAVPAPGH